MTVEFYKTRAGKKYYEHDLPRLIESNIKLAEAIEKQNKLKEKELKLLSKKKHLAITHPIKK